MTDFKKTRQLVAQPLTAADFAPFGDVIAMHEDSLAFPINQGTTQRYHRLGLIDSGNRGHQSSHKDGRIHSDAQFGISLGRGSAFHLPITLTLLERHPVGSQAWIPQNGCAFMVVVAPNGKNDQPDLEQIQAFWASGSQGVNYAAGTWHHPLLAFEQDGDFVIVDRVDDVENCEEFVLPQCIQITSVDRKS